MWNDKAKVAAETIKEGGAMPSSDSE